MAHPRHYPLFGALLLGLGGLLLSVVSALAQESDTSTSEQERESAPQSRRGSLNDSQVLTLLFGSGAEVTGELSILQPDLGQTLSSTALVRFVNSGESHPFELLRRGPSSYRFSPADGENVSIELLATAGSLVLSGEATGAGVLAVRLRPIAVVRRRSDGGDSWPFVVRIRSDRVTLSRVVRGVREEVLSEDKLEQRLTGAVPFRVELREGELRASIGVGEDAAQVSRTADQLAAVRMSVGATDGPLTIRQGRLAMSLHPEAWKSERASLAGMAVLEHVRRRDAQREMLSEIVRPTPAERLALRESLSEAQRALLDREDIAALHTALPSNPIILRLLAAGLLSAGRAVEALAALGGEEAPSGLRTAASAVALSADQPELALRLTGNWDNTEEKSADQLLIALIADVRIRGAAGLVSDDPTQVKVPSIRIEAGSWLERAVNGRAALLEAQHREREVPGQPGLRISGGQQDWLMPLVTRSLAKSAALLGCSPTLEELVGPDQKPWTSVHCLTDPWAFADAMLVLSDQRADMLGGIFVPGSVSRPSQVVVFGTAPGDEELERVLSHELTHAIIETLFPLATRLPWLNEGSAVLASACAIREEGSPEHFLPTEVQGRVEEVRAFLTGPDAGRRIHTFLNMRREDFHRPEAVALNYAVSWALVQYASGNPAGFALRELLSGKLSAADIPSERLNVIGAAAAAAMAALAQEQ